jgi:hypothetical protein
MDALQPLRPGQRGHLGGADVEHATALGDRAVSQGERQRAAGLHQPHDARQGGAPLVGIEMHEHRGHHHQVEVFAIGFESPEIGQRIVDPGDGGGGVQA